LNCELRLLEAARLLRFSNAQKVQHSYAFQGNGTAHVFQRVMLHVSPANALRAQRARRRHVATRCLSTKYQH